MILGAYGQLIRSGAVEAWFHDFPWKKMYYERRGRNLLLRPPFRN